MAPEPENKGGGGGGGQPSQNPSGGGGGGGGGQQKKKPFAQEINALQALMQTINGLLNAAAFMLLFGLPGLNDLSVTLGPTTYRGFDVIALPVDMWSTMVLTWLGLYLVAIVVGLASQWVVLMLKLTLGMENLDWIVKLDNFDIALNFIGLYVIVVEWIGVAPDLRDAVRALIAAIDPRAMVVITVLIGLSVVFDSLLEKTTRNARK